jgi:hypothetical protein
MLLSLLKNGMAMSMLMSDMQMVKHSHTAGKFAMAPLTYNCFCLAPIKIEKTYGKHMAYNQASGAHSTNSSEEKPGSMSIMNNSSCHDSPGNFKKAKSDGQVEFSKSRACSNL